MRRRVTIAAAIVATVAIAAALLVGASGAFDEARERVWVALDRDPGVAEGWVVVGLSGETEWDRYARDDRDADRIRADALAATINALGDAGAAMIVLTELFDTEDLEREEAEGLLRAVSHNPVVPSWLDSARVDLQDGRPATVTTSYRAPGAVAQDVPLAHALVSVQGELVRSVPLVVRHDAEGQALRFLPAPVAGVLALAEGLDRASSQALVPAADGSLVVGAVRVPQSEGNLRMTWSPGLVTRVPGTTNQANWRANLPYVSAQAVVEAWVGSPAVDGMVVLVGSVDPRRAEYVRVPGGPDGGVPEVWVHANVMNTLLTDSHRVPARATEDLGWLVALALLGVGVTSRLTVGRATTWVALALVGFLVSVRVRVAGGVLVDPIAPLVGLVVAWLGMFAVRYALEGRQRRRVADLFRSYVPDTVAEQLIEERTSLAALADGQRVDVTVLFCDLRGFTAQAATLEPADVRDLLNVYYRHMATIILERAGTVMQYVGDEVFAVFGAPLHQEDHAQRAVEAATLMQDAAAEIAAELAGSGIAPIAYGIGVHSGSVVAAHVGDAVRRQYSVIGDTVNVGARLCSLARPGEVVISEDVVARLPAEGRWAAAALVLEPILDAEMKGVSREFGIHRLRW